VGRKVVGWTMRDHMRQELTIAALTMAIQRQRPGLGLIHHSDRDVVMNEDHTRNRKVNGPENLAVLQHSALNIIRKEPPRTPPASSSNAPDRTTTSSPNSSPKSEMRLPWVLVAIVNSDHAVLGAIIVATRSDC
jgi:hypothetical protein